MRAVLSYIIDSQRLHLISLDISSFKSVHDCIKEFQSQNKQLNMLIENASVLACLEGRTVDSFETQFITNYLAQFLLFHLFKPTLLASFTTKFNSRVVLVSSSAHRNWSVHFDNLSLEGEYEPWKAYVQSKTALLWTADEIERRYGSKRLRAFSLHPGVIKTELLRHISAEQQATWAKDEILATYWKTPKQGAATTVWAAVSKELEGKGGKYLYDCQIASP
ncbi:oxidoreductase [Botrytis cinerea]